MADEKVNRKSKEKKEISKERLERNFFWHCVQGKEMVLGIDLKKIFKDRSVFSASEQCRIWHITAKIFSEAVMQVFEDIINNGVEFSLTKLKRSAGKFRHKAKTRPSRMSIRVEEISGEQYTKEWKAGVRRGFDPLKTGFMSYRIFVYLEKDSGTEIKIPVTLDSRHRNMLMNKANSGHMPLGPLKGWEDYVDSVNEVFPMIKRSDVSKIVSNGFKTMMSCIIQRCDVKVERRGKFFFATGVTNKTEWKMRKYIALKLFYRFKYLYNAVRSIWDGWVWFGLSTEQYAALKDAIESGVKVDYGMQSLSRIYDLAVCDACRWNEKVIMRVRKENVEHYGEKKDDKAWRFANEQTILFKDGRLIASGAEVVEKIEEWYFTELAPSKRNYMLYGSTSKRKNLPHIKKKNVMKRKELGLKEWIDAYSK